MKISKRNLDQLEVKEKRYFIWDEALQGFGVRVESSDRKTFIYRYRIDGIRRQYTLGRNGTITANQARLETL